MNKRDKEVSPLEAIRAKTQYTQEEFAVYCDIPLATYRRMILKQPSEYKLSPRQIANMCRLSGTSLEQFFIDLGIDLKGIPKS